MTKFILIFMLYGLAVTLPPNYFCMKKIEKNGMTIQWKYSQNTIDFEVFAPTQGWVAIGFNETNQLKGTHLIMGTVKEGEVILSDRYIVGIGNHQPVEKLGGINHLYQPKGEENDKGTTLSFSIPIEAGDEFHWNLRENRPFSLLIAYSMEDDFSHHSRMRTAVDITL